MPNEKMAIGCQKARLASGLLSVNGIGAGRHHAPARPSSDRLEAFAASGIGIEFAANSRGMPLIVCPFQYLAAD
jgi:hypothetical protein